MARKQREPVPGNMAQIKDDILSGLPGQLDLETAIAAEQFNLVATTQEPVETDIIPDGDYVGMRTSDVLRAYADGVHDVFAERGADFATAGAALDMVVGEYLEMVRGSIGDHNAKIAALAFCDTVLPYATLATPIVSTYAEALKIKGRRK